MKPKTINHIGISGGKDSTALALWAIHESGYPSHSIVLSFCDTGNESSMTQNYIRYLAARIGMRIRRIVPPLDFYALALKKQRNPSARARFCTQELKMLPSKAYIESLWRVGFDVLLHSGVRAAESRDRAERYEERQFSDYYGCEMFLPLYTWSLADVWAIHKRYEVAPNPMYGISERLPWNGSSNPFFGHGVMRVGCDPCVMSRKAEIAAIARYRPDRIDEIAAFERSFRNRNGFSSFFARDKVPASQRSHDILAADGRTMRVPTIRDVARWSQTSRGGQQYVMDLPLTQELIDESPTCSSKYGMCE